MIWIKKFVLLNKYLLKDGRHVMTPAHKDGTENKITDFENFSFTDSEDSVFIELSGENLKKEQKKFNEIAEKIIIEATESGFFKKDFLPYFSEKIRSITQVGFSYRDPFNKNDCLTLEEKKNLNLNTRAKYSRELIDGLTEKGITAAKNQNFIEDMFLRNFHNVSRKCELEQLKETGLKYVIISNCNDERDCKAVGLLKKRWLIDEVPELPLPECNAEYCRCIYMADTNELCSLNIKRRNEK